jgi:DNA-binding transcriptional LysR family regulator
MMSTDPGWELYRSFLAVVRQGSLSGAARILSLTQPTVGRHVEALERALGVPLFIRSQQGLTATAAGLDLVPHAEAMAAAAEALMRAASGEATAERGTVRVTASEIIGVEVLPPMLSRFRSMHPAIVLELAMTNRTEDLLRHDADIAVRMTRPSQEALVARYIGVVSIGVYAHRRYIEAYGPLRSLDDLAGHHLIGFDRDAGSIRNVRGPVGLLTRDAFAFRCDSDVGQLAALRAGLGIGGCQHAIAARDPDLVPVLPDQLRYEIEMWLAMHEDLRASRRVRLLFDHLVETLGAYIAQGRAASA